MTLDEDEIILGHYDDKLSKKSTKDLPMKKAPPGSLLLGILVNSRGWEQSGLGCGAPTSSVKPPHCSSTDTEKDKTTFSSSPL